MSLPELLEELSGHAVEVRFVPYRGRQYAALFIDNARAGDWMKVPANARAK